MYKETVGEGILKDVTRIIVETDEEKPVVICTITADDVNPVEGYRIRLKFKYND